MLGVGLEVRGRVADGAHDRIRHVPVERRHYVHRYVEELRQGW